MGARASRFSHIYIEEGVADTSLVSRIRASFPHAIAVPIRHYKDVFSRPGQSFSAQKESQKLILAAARPPFLYSGAEVCPSFGNPAFYYSSSLMNCIYDCEYCYLQGMYPSANLVIFVNIEDIFSECRRLLDRPEKGHGSPHRLYVCNSYDSDLLALRRIAPLADRWLDFAATMPELLLEMRTKSAATSIFRERKPVENVIIAWTLSPDAVAGAFERGAPPLSARMRAVAAAIEAGWRVRLCIDPMLFVSEWQEHYEGLVNDIASNIDTDRVESVSFGLFRMGKEFLKRARKVRQGSLLLAYPFALKGSVYSYPGGVGESMLSFMTERLLKIFPQEKLFPQIL